MIRANDDVPAMPASMRPPALTDTARRTQFAVAEGRAAWRRVLSAKKLAGELDLSLGQTYRRLDAAETTLRYLLASRPADGLTLLAMLAGETAELLAGDSGR